LKRARPSQLTGCKYKNKLDKIKRPGFSSGLFDYFLVTRQFHK